ncbi:MAG: hypothetical protein Q8O88_02250 [bacterium]|nr:hypothetical protein [bacterium]
MDITKLKIRLKELAKKTAGFDNDDFNTYDDSGGNFDDAYYRGCDDGEISLARGILKEFFKDEKMSNEEIRIVIAEICGWKDVRSATGLHIIWGIRPDTGYDSQVPLYTSDLNAMNGAENFLDDDQWLDYVRCLQEDVCKVVGKYNGMIAVCHATAQQRAEAFLRIFGKWSE